MDSDQRRRAFDAVEQATELPMLFLALAIIPLLVVPLAFNLDENAENVVIGLEWFIWAAFALELVVKTYLAPRRIEYLRRHWFDVLIVALPFLRPLRVVRSARALRLLRLLRVTVAMPRILHSARAILDAHGLKYVLFLAVIFIACCAVVITLLEQDSGGSITNFEDGLWWALTTVTTVGYGDTFPATAEGRAIAVVLMVIGITLFSLLTANIAAFLVQPKSDGPTLADIMKKLESLEARVEELNTRRERTFE